MKKLVFAALGVGLMIVPLANCSSSSKDDCGDISKKICEKLRDCNVLGVPFNQCVSILEDAARQEGISDEQCRDDWDSIEGMSCQQLLNGL